MMERRTALYARVSSEAQAPDDTIASQLASPRERLAAGGFLLEPDARCFDEGYGRSVLLRPALERLTDAAAAAASQVAMSMLPTGPLVVARLEASRDGAPGAFVVRLAGAQRDDESVIASQSIGRLHGTRQAGLFSFANILRRRRAR